jgi:hypothetical protein
MKTKTRTKTRPRKIELSYDQLLDKAIAVHNQTVKQVGGRYITRDMMPKHVSAGTVGVVVAATEKLAKKLPK